MNRTVDLLLNYFSVVGIFVIVGPFVGTLLVGLMIGFSVLLVPVLLISIGFMFVAGLITASVGIWLRQNNVIVPIVASIAASLVAHVTGFSFFSLGRLSAANFYYYWVVALYASFALLPSLLCWYLTRRYVRSSWPNAS